MFPKEEFDANSHEYLAPTPDRSVDQRILQLVADFVIARLGGERILELGVGDQVWTPKLAARFRSVTTVDGSKRLLAAMQQRLQVGNWTPVVSRFETYAPQELFDTVVATYVLEHVDDPALILRLARDHWLRSNGQLAIVVPHALSLHRRLAVKMGLARYPEELGETDKRMQHKHCFTIYDLEGMLATHGFDLLESVGLFTKVLPNSQLVQCSDAQLQGLVDLGRDLPIEYASVVFLRAEKRCS
jgi:2-polyprenyl-3-methyl-5-hydroxy-6-metoxy-1,4-benzoquinol methylase